MPKTANVPTSEPPITHRKIPEIPLGAVTRNSGGTVYQSYVVRLPEGFISDDLKETTGWQRVQNSQNTALRRHDELYLIAFDESWIATARVAHANAKEVQLAGIKITGFEPRTKPLLKTDEFEVKWFGAAYAVERRSDGQRLTDFFASEVLAERALQRLYPSPVQ